MPFSINILHSALQKDLLKPLHNFQVMDLKHKLHWHTDKPRSILPVEIDIAKTYVILPPRCLFLHNAHDCGTFLPLCLFCGA